jgi:hypothetical protein
MTETKPLPITESEATFLETCLNALKVIMLNGTSADKEAEQQAKQNAITLNSIQAKIPAFN